MYNDDVLRRSREAWLEPDDYDEPEEVAPFDAMIEVKLDDNIMLDEAGYRYYSQFDSAENLVEADDYIYDDEYHVRLTDLDGLLDDIDFLLKPYLPAENTSGTFHVTGSLYLCYSVSGIDKYNDGTYNTEYATSFFNPDKSYAKDIQVVQVS